VLPEDLREDVVFTCEEIDRELGVVEPLFECAALSDELPSVWARVRSEIGQYLDRMT
jgi:hypothetical protein